MQRSRACILLSDFLRVRKGEGEENEGGTHRLVSKYIYVLKVTPFQTAPL